MTHAPSTNIPFKVIEFEAKAAKFKEMEMEHERIAEVDIQTLQNKIVELEKELNFQTERSKELENKNVGLSKFKLKRF